MSEKDPQNLRNNSEPATKGFVVSMIEVAVKASVVPLVQRIKSMEVTFAAMLNVMAQIDSELVRELGSDEIQGVPLPDGYTYRGLSDPGKTYYPGEVVWVRGTGFQTLIKKPDGTLEWRPYVNGGSK